MNKRPLLEICVETLYAAMAAARAGADRIELCGDLSVGGVTPSAAIVRQARQKLGIPIHVMIRPRGGNFCYSESETAQMVRDINEMKICGVDGIVLGLLRADGRVDVERSQRMVEHANPLPVTFHRAFDEAPNVRAVLGDVIRTGAARILTSGGANSAEEGVSALAGLVAAADGKIEIMPGGGITSLNINRIASVSRAREFHSGLTSVRPTDPSNFETFETEIKKLAIALKEVSAEANPTP